MKFFRRLFGKSQPVMSRRDRFACVVLQAIVQKSPTGAMPLMGAVENAERVARGVVLYVDALIEELERKNK